MDTVEYEWVTFENEFLTAPTKYRGKPTPELEQAWKALYHCETIQLTVILAIINSKGARWSLRCGYKQAWSIKPVH